MEFLVHVDTKWLIVLYIALFTVSRNVAVIFQFLCQNVLTVETYCLILFLCIIVAKNVFVNLSFAATNRMLEFNSTLGKGTSESIFAGLCAKGLMVGCDHTPTKKANLEKERKK